MNTHHTTTRTAVRASALTVALTALLLGASGVAGADPSTNPAPAPPGPSRANIVDQPVAPSDPTAGTTVGGSAFNPALIQPHQSPWCVSCQPRGPVLTASNSGSVVPGQGPVTLSVTYWDLTPDSSVTAEVFFDGKPLSCAGPYTFPTDPSGAEWTVGTGCHTTKLNANDGAIQLTDTKSGIKSGLLPIMVFER